MNPVLVGLVKNIKNAVVPYKENTKQPNKTTNPIAATKFNFDRKKFLTIGRSKGFVSQLDDLSTLSMKKNKINIFIENFFKSKIKLIISFIAIALLNYLVFFL